MSPRYRLQFVILLAAAVLAAAPAHAQSAPPADYQARLAQYHQARAAYDQEASVYWDQVAEKRRGRNDKRRDQRADRHRRLRADPAAGLYRPAAAGRSQRAARPAAWRKGAAPGDRGFPQSRRRAIRLSCPTGRRSELEFKRAYAKAASAAGLTRDQIVGVYAFETGGNGTYDMQAGVTPTRPNAISPAVGYNQLLSTNTVSILAEHGNRLIALLRQKAKTLTGPEKIAIERKIEAFKRMIALSRSVPQRWSDFDIMAKTTPGGWGIHAAILDRDIGPQLQVQKLATSLHFARMKHYSAPLTAAELELMNLTGDSTGLDMVMMPHDFARARADREFLPAERL